MTLCFELQGNPNYVLFASGVDFQKYDDIIDLDLEDGVLDYLAFGFPQGSRLVEHFNHALQRMRETGILDLLRQKWFPNRHPSHLESHSQDGGDGEQGSALGFENLSFPFCGLLLGIVFGTILALLERISKWGCVSV